MEVSPPSLEAILIAAILKADLDVTGESEVLDAAIIYIKWSVELYGIYSKKVETLLNDVYEMFKDRSEYRNERKFLGVCVIRAFVLRNVPSQLQHMAEIGFEKVNFIRSIQEYSEVVADIVNSTFYAAPAELERTAVGLSCEKQCQKLSMDWYVQGILLKIAKETFHKKRQPLGVLSAAEVALRDYLNHRRWESQFDH